MGIAFMGLSFSLEAADGNPPELMTYQGYLVDGTGAPLGAESPENHDVVFRIWTALESGVKKWSEQQTVTVDKGYFSVLLGEGSQFNSEPYPRLSTVFYGADISERFLGMTVLLGGKGNEISPRLRWVSSPFAFSSSQARQLIDDSGNRNFYKDGAELRLGVGAESTLNIKENGDVNINGKLNVNLPEYGYNITLKNGAKTTNIGARYASHFYFNTDMPDFYFNKPIQVNGRIYSYNQDTILSPSNNSGNDNYLKIYKDKDVIEARTKEFKVTGNSNSTFEIKMNNSTEFLTSNYQFYMNKKLTNAGGFYVDADRGIKNVTGQFGTVQTVGNGKSGYEGYSIDGRYAFMSKDNNEVGIYNDLDNQWILYNKKDSHLVIRNPKTFKDSIVLTSTQSQFKAPNGEHALIVENDAFVLRVPKTQKAAFYANKDVVRLYNPISGNYAFNVDKDRTRMWSSAGNYAFCVNDNGTIHLPTTIDASATTAGFNGGALFIGDSAGVHLRMDGNEIMANKNNSTSTLYLNNDGGDVIIKNYKKSSDRRLKHNISSIEYGLNELLRLKPVSYHWKPEFTNVPGVQLGFIAQDVKEVIPELVSTSEDNEESEIKDILSLSVDGFTPILVAGIKELKQEKDDQVAALQEENQSLRADVNKLREELSEVKDILSGMGTLSSRLKDIEGYVSRLGKTN